MADSAVEDKDRDRRGPTPKPEPGRLLCGDPATLALSLAQDSAGSPPAATVGGTALMEGVLQATIGGGGSIFGTPLGSFSGGKLRDENGSASATVRAALSISSKSTSGQSSKSSLTSLDTSLAQRSFRRTNDPRNAACSCVAATLSFVRRLSPGSTTPRARSLLRWEWLLQVAWTRTKCCRCCSDIPSPRRSMHMRRNSRRARTPLQRDCTFRMSAWRDLSQPGTCISKAAVRQTAPRAGHAANDSS
mmetsp:Transcript_51028/g.118882  ORF Transcript_51028/g.118882 Transcript_51028/m.118882 type:complete len:247 (-) Transcript_51028:700-1440(-)